MAFGSGSGGNENNNPDCMVSGNEGPTPTPPTPNIDARFAAIMELLVQSNDQIIRSNEHMAKIQEAQLNMQVQINDMLQVLAQMQAQMQAPQAPPVQPPPPPHILQMPPYLPSGYRFMPTDEELINDYLLKKVLGEQLPLDVVIEGEIYGDNAQLPEGNGSVEEQYLFVKSKKNQKGTRMIRSAGNGCWKVTGDKKKILDKKRNHIGTKISLVFKRESNSRRKKNLLMDEYSLTRSMIQNNPEGWVLCKIKQSNRSPERPNSQEEEGDGLTSRPTASPALQGIDNNLTIDDMEFFDFLDLLAPTEDNPTMGLVQKK